MKVLFLLVAMLAEIEMKQKITFISRLIIVPEVLYFRRTIL